MTNYNRMVINPAGNACAVFRAKRGQQGTPTDMAQCTHYWYVPTHAKPLFSGCMQDCESYIKSSGAMLITL